MLYGKFYVISKGKTLAEATDAAIGRYNRKHGMTSPEVPERIGLEWLQVRGWVSKPTSTLGNLTKDLRKLLR